MNHSVVAGNLNAEIGNHNAVIADLNAVIADQNFAVFNDFFSAAKFFRENIVIFAAETGKSFSSGDLFLNNIDFFAETPVEFEKGFKQFEEKGDSMLKFVRILSGFVFVLALMQSISAATFVVTKTADTSDGTCDADCSLREAVAAANASPEADIINFSSLFDTAQTITLGGTDIIFTNSGGLVVNGPGADKLTVSGNNASRVFTNNTGAATTLRSLRVTGGTGVSTVSTGRGGGVYNSGGTLTLFNLVLSGNTAANGGAGNNAGTATLNIFDCVISNNTTTGAGGALQNFAGNTTNIRNSAIHNNTSNSTLTGGGAMQANGIVNISNTTFANNTATGGSGGAIYYNGTSLIMTNNTLAGNTATLNGGGLHKSTTTATAFFRNNIIAQNNGVAASPDVTGAINSEGNNLLGNVGTSTGWGATDLQNVNPMLGAFGNNGGFGSSFLPMAGSPAVNAGQNCVVDLSCAANNPPFALVADQRGVSRLTNGNVDIGAIEVAAVVNVSVGGRVLSDTGAPMPNTLVFLTAPGGPRSTRTNSYGFYSFDGIAVGSMISVGVSSKAFSYATVPVTVNGQISDLDFQPSVMRVK